jgi:hypothetical protein
VAVICRGPAQFYCSLELISQAGLDFLWKAATSAVAGSGSKGRGAPLTRAERVKMAMWEEEEQFIFHFYSIYLVGLLLTPLESSVGRIFWAPG